MRLLISLALSFLDFLDLESSISMASPAFLNIEIHSAFVLITTVSSLENIMFYYTLFDIFLNMP